ncbi:hypothetical protein [Methylobacterium sp. J-068]|uniref:hypothetical protein n=1 Tax=Methylobacterium sp. J-068 TaxID=2836649 RepID=UPI001FB8D8B2|nr:hypothetical protein [Methylobacterium sp. J-068]MCJ2036604.1 hypothetical protein [Methylobacterium sp. J-068]
MGRIGLLGRIMPILLGALSILVLATVALDRWQRSQEQSPYATRFPASIRRRASSACCGIPTQRCGQRSSGR